MSLVLDRYGILDKSRSRLRRAEVPGIGHAMGSTGAIGERPTFNRPNIERPNAHWEENMLKLPRRRFLHLAAGAAALPVVPRIAMAQAFPTRPVRIVVPFAAGGATDIIARLIGQWLSERLGQQFVIENRPGAGSNIGTEMVVNAPPDGYTLLQVGASSAINATLYEKLSFNFLRDIAPVSGIISIPFIMAVNHRSQRRQFPSSSPMPGPTRARSTWRRAATERRAICRANCSR
jgi:Tripartite tricarboxylate transporter family receptor